jgi:hypothetical protein
LNAADQREWTCSTVPAKSGAALAHTALAAICARVLKASASAVCAYAGTLKSQHMRASVTLRCALLSAAAACLTTALIGCRCLELLGPALVLRCVGAPDWCRASGMARNTWLIGRPRAVCSALWRPCLLFWAQSPSQVPGEARGVCGCYAGWP